MVPKKNNLFWRIIFIAKEWIDWSNKSPSNFAKLTVAWASLTILTRLVIFECFSNVPVILNKLLIFGFLGAMVSIVIFYIKFHYAGTIKKALYPLINVDRITSNIDKRTYIREAVKKENPQLKLWVETLILPLVILSTNIRNLPEEFQVSATFFVISLFALYATYMLKIRRALMYAEIPHDQIPVMPYALIKWWHFSYIVRTKINLLLRGHGAPGSGVVLKSTIQYMASPEFQQKAKAAGTIIGLGTAIGGVVFATETVVSSCLDHTPLSYILMSSAFRGYWTPSPSTRQRFSEIKDFIPEGQIPTFFIPGTHKLDSNAVMKAKQKLEKWKEDFKVNETPLPDLIGPYPISNPISVIPPETKEASLSDLLSFE